MADHDYGGRQRMCSARKDVVDLLTIVSFQSLKDLVSLIIQV